MGNGMSVLVAHIRSSSFASSNKVFHLKHVLHVLQIYKNLLSVAQFAADNQVFIEFHPYIIL